MHRLHASIQKFTITITIKRNQHIPGLKVGICSATKNKESGIIF